MQFEEEMHELKMQQEEELARLKAELEQDRINLVRMEFYQLVLLLPVFDRYICFVSFVILCNLFRKLISSTEIIYKIQHT